MQRLHVGLHVSVLARRNGCVVRRPSLHLRAEMSQGYTFPHEDAARDRGARILMKLVHLIFAVITLAAVSVIAIAGPSQAEGDAGGLYLREAAS